MPLLKNSLSSKTILIVDDKTNNLQLLSKYLNKAGYKVLSAQSGTKAIETANVLRPDLILLDVMMPVMNGFDVCRHLKSNLETKDIPLIFMTSSTETNSKVVGFKLGAVDYITKPIEEKELLARVKTHLALNQLRQSSLRDSAQRQLLFKISDRIRQSLELKMIFQTAAQEIRTFLDCDFVGLTCLSKQKATQKITIKAHSSREGIVINPQKSIPFDDLCPSHDVYQSYLKEHIKSTGSKNIQNYVSEIPSVNPQARLTVPILVKDINHTPGFFSSAEDSMVTSDILYGWLIVEQYSSPRTWQPEEISLLKEITTQLAIGIKHRLLHRQLSKLALLDSLTWLYNRRSFDQQLKREWGRLKHIPAPLSLIMCDVDCFKIYNDVYGHQQGDKCLQQVAKAISLAPERSGDISARYGGEEFAIILPHTEGQGAIKVAEDIHQQIQLLQIPHNSSKISSIVSLSLGVSSIIPNTRTSADILISAADDALYDAKLKGRNCIIYKSVESG